MNNYLVVGLGNIGAEYAQTRHNMGFMVLDAWAQASNILFMSGRYGSTAELSFKGRKFTLLKPSTYMNLGGKAVRYWMTQLNIPVENLIVICDDLNLPFGTLRMRTSGSNGGHNGLGNINELLGTQAYTRIRMGIGNDYLKGQQIDFVLGKLTDEEMEQMPELSKKVISACRCYATAGAGQAMTILNAKAPQKTQKPQNEA
ncbi:MAG: aminoacyl-tRNA hydrolase [Bacteroidales bacterium]|nr:aminoacyl-tRNA hydrolase [Bacteroidales bacterium]